MSTTSRIGSHTDIWTSREDKILAENFNLVGRLDELELLLPGRTIYAIKTRAQRLKVSRTGRSPALILAILQDGPADARTIAEALNMTAVCIRFYLRQLIKDGKAHIADRIFKGAKNHSLPTYIYAIGQKDVVDSAKGIAPMRAVPKILRIQKEEPAPVAERDSLTAALFGFVAPVSLSKYESHIYIYRQTD